MKNTYDYNHALWILEHSYPTLNVNEALNEAGADITSLKTEIGALHSGESIDIDKTIEDYVFVVVQFSIWRATGATIDGVKIGNSLTGTNGVELKELNKLYQYLNQDREIYNNYGSLTYANTIEFVNQLLVEKFIVLITELLNMDLML
ncbi:MAG: Cys-Gln thioester bond-forming surface protein [Clostridium sp.]|nr:MAG: Cys-Gln thioester bond-forming surface protein [Clostridium sp.]